ncbi:hypothetical protein LTR14_011668 [Exophiala xenobiotica]|nr:hypothetical protein LTR14_011668 [Exophiala xenobiotica]
MASTPSAKQTYACLEIPMPSCMRDFVTHSSTPPPRPGGAYVDSLIANFGNVHGKAMEEVEKCRLLADGPDDIVILLERPATDHDYSAPLAEFVSCSETLRAVDELIRFATRAQRNIQNVSVVDVFSLKPEGANAPSDDECHDLAKEILLAKKPKVIIGCTTKIRQSHWLYCLNGKVTGVPCTKYIDLGINEHSALFVRSFHPGYCVNRVDWCVESRIKLVYDFVFAFQATTRPVEHPSWLSSISSLRAKQSHKRPSRGDDLIDLLFNLRRIHRISSRDTIVLEARKEGLYYTVMVEVLWTLPAVSGKKQALMISKALRAWQLRFPRDPLQNHFTAQLMALGHLQDYFTDDQHILTSGLEDLQLRPLKPEIQTTLSGTQWEDEVPELENVGQACRTLRYGAGNIPRAVLLFTNALPENPDFIDTARNLVETLKKSWTSLQKFVGLVSALPTVLEGGPGLFLEEENSGEQPILRRRDARTRVQGLFEHILPTATDMLKRIEGMKKLAREGLPSSVVDHIPEIDELRELIELIRKDVGAFENELEESIRIFVTLRISLAGVCGLIEEGASPSVPLSLERDRTLKEIYQQDILPAAKLKKALSRAWKP